MPSIRAVAGDLFFGGIVCLLLLVYSPFFFASTRLLYLFDVCTGTSMESAPPNGPSLLFMHTHVDKVKTGDIVSFKSLNGQGNILHRSMASKDVLVKNERYGTHQGIPLRSTKIQSGGRHYPQIMDGYVLTVEVIQR